MARQGEPTAEEALQEGRWEDARALFEAALAEAETADALVGLSNAVWWLGDAAESVRLMERAYSVQRREGQLADAISTAIGIAVVACKSLGNEPVCRGWLARARTLLAEHDAGPLEGWVRWAECVAARDAEEAIDLGEGALAIARASGDRDLELCAMSELGCAMVAAGRIDEGFALVDEAMAGVRGREFGTPDTVAATCCAMLEACDRVADLARIRHWLGVADDFMATYGSPFIYADCRHRHGSILLATGHWEDAESELRAAMRATTPDSAYHVLAVTRLAELRLRQGRFEEAEGFADAVAEHPSAQPVLAAVKWMRGELAVAAATAERWLAAHGTRDGMPAPVLGLLTQIRIEQRELDAADDAVDRLVALAAEQDAPRVGAHAAFAQAAAATARGDEQTAVPLLERAIDLFAICSLPYETARARALLAQALRSSHPEVAISEAQGALAIFERLGATWDAAAVDAFLRALGARARPGTRDAGVLTKREQEVLALLAQGLSNPEIADRLFISHKTVGHHVGNVYMKLGVRNRTEAAAYAARLGTTPGG